MRDQVQDERLYFRANGILVEAVRRRASDAGMSVSELLRTIARERVGLN
jgi:predicted DNA binding CopG/RHH family protein